MGLGIRTVSMRYLWRIRISSEAAIFLEFLLKTTPIAMGPIGNTFDSAVETSFSSTNEQKIPNYFK